MMAVLGCRPETSQVPQPTRSPEQPTSVAESRGERVAARVRPLLVHPWSQWPAGVTVVRGFVSHGRGADIADNLQPELTYEVAAAGEMLVRRQTVDGKVITQELGMHPEEGLPRPRGRGEQAEVAVDLELDGDRVPSVLSTFPGVTHEHDAPSPITRQWTLAGERTVLLRSETSQVGATDEPAQWWAVTGLDRPKTIGDAVFPCVEVRRRTGTADGHVIVTTFLHQNVPGHVVEEISEYFKASDRARPWLVTVERVLRIGR